MDIPLCLFVDEQAVCQAGPDPFDAVIGPSESILDSEQLTAISLSYCSKRVSANLGLLPLCNRVDGLLSTL